jgi:hypothetical protein
MFRWRKILLLNETPGILKERRIKIMADEDYTEDAQADAVEVAFPTAPRLDEVPEDDSKLTPQQALARIGALNEQYVVADEDGQKELAGQIEALREKHLGGNE